MKGSSNQVIKFFLGIMMVFVVLFVVIKISAKKTAKTQSIETELNMTAQDFFLPLQDDQRDEFASYVEKAIEVEGVVKNITQRDGVYSLILEGENMGRNVICEMQRDQDMAISKLKVGDKIMVKGIFKGFLLDAILLNCIKI